MNMHAILHDPSPSPRRTHPRTPERRNRARRALFATDSPEAKARRVDRTLRSERRTPLPSAHNGDSDDSLAYLDDTSSDQEVTISHKCRWNFDFGLEQPVQPTKSGSAADSLGNWRWYPLDPKTVPAPYKSRASTSYRRHYRELPSSVLDAERHKIEEHKLIEAPLISLPLMDGSDSNDDDQESDFDNAYSRSDDSDPDEPSVLAPRVVNFADEEASGAENAADDDDTDSDDGVPASNQHAGEASSPQLRRRVGAKYRTPRRKQPSRKAKQAHVDTISTVR